MYFGRGDHVPGKLSAGHARARAARLESNRRLSCAACRQPVQNPPGLPDPSAIRACCRCTPKCLECRDSQLRYSPTSTWNERLRPHR
jgi:hypothetical protein